MRNFGSFRRSPSAGIVEVGVEIIVIVVYFGDGRELAMRS
jgi:hypothetical protein